MKEKITFLLIFVNMLLFALNDNYILDSEGEQIYFSLGGMVNSEYFKDNKYKSRKILTDFYLEKYNSTREVNLPDSLCNKYIKLGRGYKSININPSIVDTLEIEGFAVTVGEFGKCVTISFTDSISYFGTDLYLISEKSSTLSQVNKNVIKTVKNTKLNQTITESLINYFISNPNVLSNQFSIHNQMPDSLNNQQIKQIINSRFEFEVIKLDDNSNTFLVNGKGIRNKSYSFVATIFLNDNDIRFITTAKFIDVFKISNSYFLYCQNFKAGSGGMGYEVYRIYEDKLELVFGDGSYSM